MRHLLTVCLVAFSASAAFAQMVNGPAMIQGNGVIYNLNPMPPIVSNNRVQYPAGTAYVDRFGKPQACNGPLTIDNTGAQTRIVCNQPDITVETTPPMAANDFSNLAPAAGGAPSTSLLGDSNLASDRKAGLRSDRAMPRAGY